MDNQILQIIFGGVLFILVLFAYSHARTANKDAKSKFNFEDLFVDTKGRTSIDKIGQFIALSVSTWAFIYYTLAYKLTEWMFFGYMTAWAAAKATNKWLEYKKLSATPPTKD